MKLGFISNLVGLHYIDDAYIVGGTVRDIYICKDPDDIDIAVRKNTETFARTLLKKIDGTLFFLDKKRGIFRLLTKRVSPPFYFDISPLRGGDIYTDLSYRDFTIDAMAIPISDIGQLENWEISKLGIPPINQSTIPLIDPYNGAEDIKRKRIRVISDNSFVDDPLRLLRAFRLASTLNYEIESNTFNVIRKMSTSLRISARERIRDEFFRLLSSNHSVQYLNKMYDAGLLKEVLTGLDNLAIREGLIVLERLDYFYSILQDLFSPFEAEIDRYLETEIEGGVSNASLWKCLSFYIGCGATRGLMMDALENLRLGKRVQRIAIFAIEHGKAPILTDERVDTKALYYFFKTAGDDGIGLILYQMASIASNKLNSDMVQINAKDAILWYLYEYKEMRKSPLLTGDDLSTLFHLPPGPEYKRLLDLVETDRAAGLLQTKNDAISFLKKLLTNV